MNTRDQIRLQLPANPEYGRLGRIAAAQFARRQGLSLQEIDDLRLAMDEVVTLLVGANPTAGTVTLDFTASDHALLVDARLDLDDDDQNEAAPGLSSDRIDRFEAQAAPLVSHVAVDPIEARVTFTKTHRPPR